MNLQFIPLGVSFKNITIAPKNKIKTYLSPVTIKNILIKPNYLALLKGNISINSIDIIDSDLKLIIKKFEKSNKNKITNLDFLEKIPVSNLNLKNVNLYIKLHPMKTSLKIAHLNSHVENLENALIAKVESKNIIVKQSDDDKQFHFSLNSKFLLENKSCLLYTSPSPRDRG